MKVAVAASLLKPISSESTGGTEAFAHLLTEGLVKAGVDVDLFATSDSKTRAKLISVCSSLQTTGIYEGDLDTRIPYQLLQSNNIISKSKEYDIIHNNYFHFYLLSAFSSLTDKPIVTTMHNHYWQLPNLKIIAAKTHRRGKDIVVFASQAAKKLAGDLFDSEVIYHGIDISPYNFLETPQDYFLCFGRLVPSKGIKDALTAAAAGKFNLKVAGGLPVRPDEKTYFNLNIEPFFTGNITYVGSPEETQKILLYRNAKALVFPTQLEEQFGFVIVEAMACGTPVIAYNIGSIPEVVKDGVTGFIIDADDSDRPGKGSWVIKKKGIEGIIQAVERIGEIDRKTCREHVEKNFTQEIMIQNYIKLYERVLKNKKQSSVTT